MLIKRLATFWHVYIKCHMFAEPDTLHLTSWSRFVFSLFVSMQDVLTCVKAFKSQVLFKNNQTSPAFYLQEFLMDVQKCQK